MWHVSVINLLELLGEKKSHFHCFFHSALGKIKFVLSCMLKHIFGRVCMNVNFRDIYQKQDNNRANTEFLKAALKLRSKYQEGGEVTPGELTWKLVKISGPR